MKPRVIGSDIDYVAMSWRYRGAWLQHGTGPMWSFGFRRRKTFAV